MTKAHLLVTNDDGIDTHFFKQLVQALAAKDFQLTIAAPAREQSWVSRAMSRHREVEVKRLEEFPCPAYAIDGTPTDCVNIALGHLVEGEVDAVVSGINLGVNVTLPLTMSSGTVAAALEGMFWEKPSFAFSQLIPKERFEAMRIAKGALEGSDVASLEYAASRAASIVEAGLEEGLPPGIVRSVNFPNGVNPDSPFKLARLAKLKLGSLFKEIKPGIYAFQFQDGKVKEPDEFSDSALLQAGFITQVDIPYHSLCGVKE